MSTEAMFIDLKKAFDLVDHECLLYKLEHYGVRGSSLDWFRNCLMTPTHFLGSTCLLADSSAGLNSRPTSFCFIHK